MSTITNRYCPHCYRQLNEGVKDWLWCPDTYHCEYECDISKNDATLSRIEALKLKREKLIAQRDALIEQHNRDIEQLQNEIDNIKN